MTAQFDVYVNPAPAARRAYPFVVVLQSDLIDVTATRVVAPASILGGAVYPVSRLLPAVLIDQRRHAVLIPRLFAISKSELRERVGSVRESRADLIAAIDLLFVGV